MLGGKKLIDDSDDTRSPLEKVIKQIESSFGKGTVMKLESHQIQIPPEDIISTGSLSLDIALGIGGLPKGRIVEIFGPESSGKTTLALQVIASAQAQGGQCVFVDAEHALDVNWAKKLGVQADRLLVCQPDSGEQGLEIVDTLVQTGEIDVIVIDSVAALVPRSELEGEMGASQIGTQARLMSQALRKLTGSLKKNNTLLIFLNQIRMKVGVLFGSPETTSGGNALKFYASTRLEIRRIGSLKKGDNITANQVRVKVVKNKLAAPFKTAEFDIEFGKGISRESEILDLGVKSGHIQKSGSWYTLANEDVQLGQGRDKAKQFLEENKELSDSLIALIRQSLIEENQDLYEVPDIQVEEEEEDKFIPEEII